MQEKERVILVKWAQYFLPGTLKVQDMSGELFIIDRDKGIYPGSMITIEHYGEPIPFRLPAWRVKESETTDAGIPS